MHRNLFDCVNIDPAKTNLPDGTNPDAADACAKYNAIIHSVGGINLQLLGLGLNGHIGFNEPGEAFELETHCVDLTQETIEANKRFFDGNVDLVPKQAYTMGIRTIMQARKVLMVVNGAGKAEIVKKAFFVNWNRIFTIDKSRIQRFLGWITQNEMQEIEKGVVSSLALAEITS